MGIPNKSNHNPVDGAMSELVSALSALAMPPEALVVCELCGHTPNEEYDSFLRDVDAYAHHAAHHIKQAYDYLNER